MNANSINVKVLINAPISIVWELWTNPADIMHWNNLSLDWQTTRAENDLRPGGRFLFVMGLKDGSFSFNFEGTYDEVIDHKLISYTLDDGRRSSITFSGIDRVVISETFEPTDSEPAETQQGFCRAVLESFKLYAEGKS